jgi:GNAT superfamily N-acetyltransferase
MRSEDRVAALTRESPQALTDCELAFPEHAAAPTAAALPAITPAWQWTQAEQQARYGLHFSAGGDAVPGGYNYTFSAEDPETGERLGFISLNTAGKDAVIAHVEVNPEARGRGIATKLLDYARHYEPDMTISHGLQTDQGASWAQKLPAELKQNPIQPLERILDRRAPAAGLTSPPPGSATTPPRVELDAALHRS